MDTQPKSLSAAITKLQGTGFAMAAQNAAVAVPITGMAPAAADEISLITATQFALEGASYQSASAQAKAMHDLFLNILSAGAATAAVTEAAATQLDS